MKRLWPAVFALWCLPACAPKEVNYAVKIITQNCDPSANPFDGVTTLRVKITGPDMEPLTAITAINVATPEVKVPDIPAGLKRVVEVRAYDGEPASGGRVVSVGQSVPFDVPDVVPDELMGGSIPVNVVLRRVGMFSPIVSASAPDQCQQLRVPRAGHAAVRMQSGKVFISGGYNFKQGSNQKQALTDAEIFNPATGAFELATPLSITTQDQTYPQPMAFHTATLMNNGQVVLWGGETYDYGGNVEQAQQRTTIMIYAEDIDQYGAMPTRTEPRPIPRAHHRAALDANGKLLIVGGVKTGNVPVPDVEWLDPGSESTRPTYLVVPNVTLPRLGAAVAPVKAGEFVAVAGGSDGLTMKTDVSFFKFNGSTFVQQVFQSPPVLAGVGRRNAAVAPLNGGADLLLMGGYTSATDDVPSPDSEKIVGATATVVPGPNLGASATVPGRGDACAAQLGTDAVLLSGGRTADQMGVATRSDRTSVIFTPPSSGGLTSLEGPNLPRPRYFHTCTTLNDGSVLVTGGIDETFDGTTTTTEILQDAYIYTPVPPAD